MCHVANKLIGANISLFFGLHTYCANVTTLPLNKSLVSHIFISNLCCFPLIQLYFIFFLEQTYVLFSSIPLIIKLFFVNIQQSLTSIA